MNTTYALSTSRTLQPLTNELAIIRLSQQGDQEMFGRLYETYMERIYRYVYFRVADDMLAEDITSQVFLKVWEKLNTYQIGQCPFMAWIYRIAHNAVIDYYRTKKVTISIDDVKPVELSHTDETDEKVDFQIQSQELRKTLQELTDEQQQVLILKFMHGFSTSEIAQHLGKQEGAVRALQMRGLQRLAQCPGLRMG